MVLSRDFLYFGTLFACIAMGRFYKRLDNMDVKRNYGAGLGFIVTCLVCRHYALYSLILVWGNVMIIKCSDKRYVNELSISFTWLFLVYIGSNIGPGDYAMFINQILALRLVGLANEINMAENERITLLKNVAKVPNAPAQPAPTLQPNEAMLLEVNAIDVATYAYHFIGLHKGPYYRFKEYIYHFKSPFTKLGDFRLITTEKLKKTLMYMAGYALLRIQFTPKVYYDDRFYNEKFYNTELRFLYNVPLLIMYVLKHQIVVMLSTCVFTEAGFGVYPALCGALPGHGPSANEHLLQDDSDAVTQASQFEYNFAMLRCYDNKRLLIGPKMRDTLQKWDISTRYWFFTYIYNNMPNVRKEVRSAAAFMAWSIWLGPSLAQFIMVATLWVMINLEHEYTVLFNVYESPSRTAWMAGMSIMRLLCFIYLTPCFVISDSFVVFKFYNSICWIYHVTMFLFIIMAIILFKVRLNATAAPTPPPPPPASTSTS